MTNNKHMESISEWPNKLGFDIGSAEIWKHAESFRVFTDDKVLRVPYAVTANPSTALALCIEQGLSREALDEMEYNEAQTLYMATVPNQKELF